MNYIHAFRHPVARCLLCIAALVAVYALMQWHDDSVEAAAQNSRQYSKVLQPSSVNRL